MDWSDLQAGVFALTNKPALIAETDIALRQAIRTAHKSGKYWRDLVKLAVTPVVAQIQEIDISQAPIERFRQLAYLKSTELDKMYRPVGIDDLLDEDNYARTDVCWGLGTKLLVRSSTPETSYDLCFYQYPSVVIGQPCSSWILNQHEDLIFNWAASTILGLVGEQEIKSRVDQLAAIAFADLQQDNLEIEGR